MFAFIYYLTTKISKTVLLQVQDFENINKVNLEYFAVYVLPFLGINIQSWNTALALLLLFIIIGIMYVKSDSIFMNPLFTLIGLNIFRLKIAKAPDVVLITRGVPAIDHPQTALELSEGIFIAR